MVANKGMATLQNIATLKMAVRQQATMGSQGQISDSLQGVTVQAVARVHLGGIFAAHGIGLGMHDPPL